MVVVVVGLPAATSLELEEDASFLRTFVLFALFFLQGLCRFLFFTFKVCVIIYFCRDLFVCACLPNGSFIYEGFWFRAAKSEQICRPRT